jgi:glycosyltransferase involved in cell wall biosynthesis
VSASLNAVIVSANDALFEDPQGDDGEVVQALAERLGRLSVVIASGSRAEGIGQAGAATLVRVRARSRPQGLASIFRALKRIHDRAPLTVIQAQEPFYTGAAALLGARRLRAGLVIGAFGADPYDPGFTHASLGHRLATPVGRAVMRGADVVQTDTHVIAERLRERGLPARYKPMTPLDLHTFLRHGASRTHRDPAEVVLSVGRLGRQKRLPLLLEALAALRALRPGVRLVLVGDGPDRSALEAQAARAGLADAVEFRGALSRDRLAAEYLEADVLACASTYEGMPRVFLEAAATGLPIVSTPVAGALELAAAGPVTIADPSASGLAAALRMTLDDAEGRRRGGDALRELARERAEERSPVERQLEIWEELSR